MDAWFLLDGMSMGLFPIARYNPGPTMIPASLDLLLLPGKAD